MITYIHSKEGFLDALMGAESIDVIVRLRGTNFEYQPPCENVHLMAIRRAITKSPQRLWKK